MHQAPEVCRSEGWRTGAPLVCYLSHFASGEPRVKPIRTKFVTLASVFLCALLSVAGCSKKTQEKTQQAVDAAKAAASSAAQDAKQQASDAADKAKQQASDAAQKAGREGAAIRERCRLPGHGSRQGKSEKSCRRRKSSHRPGHGSREEESAKGRGRRQASSQTTPPQKCRTNQLRSRFAQALPEQRRNSRDAQSVSI